MKIKERVLTIDKSCIFKTKIEKVEEFENSLFSDVYSEAAEILSEIINDDMNKNEDDYNNIIAFVGERGSGKTSSMKSFRNSLNGDELKKASDINLDSYDKLQGDKFELLDIIDPTLFSSEESIIEIIVAQMFKKFKDIKQNTSLMDKKKLADKFQQVYKDIKIINTNKCSILDNTFDEFEGLMNLSSAVSLKEDMVELVKSYLGYINMFSKNNKSFLVIAIDDLDMNLTVGEKMLEDIRKYLIIPNVIILIAVKFEQLEEIVFQRFINGLSENYKIYKDLKEEKEFKEKIDNKTEKYLEKIIPYNRRVNMPKINVKGINLKINIRHFKNIIRGNNDNGIWNIREVRKIIFENFINKFHYIITTENHYNNLIISNLRSFIELIVLLNSIKFDDNSHSINENLKKLLEYYSKAVFNGIRYKKKRDFLIELLNCDFRDINKKSLLFLNDFIDNKNLPENHEIVKRKDWIKKNKNIINGERIELGDIITWIKMCQIISSKASEVKFIEIFKSVYSIRLIMESHNDKVQLYRSTGVDFIGDYFIISNNSYGNKLIEPVYLKMKDVNELISSNNEVDSINENIKDMIHFLMKPVFSSTDNNLFYDRLIRREIKEYISDEDYVSSNFANFILKPTNFIGFNVYRELLKEYKEEYVNLYSNKKTDGKYAIDSYVKNDLFGQEQEKNYSEIDEKEIMNIINIDFWLKVLDYLDKSIETSYNGAKDKLDTFRYSTIEKVYSISSELFKKYVKEDCKIKYNDEILLNEFKKFINDIAPKIREKSEKMKNNYDTLVQLLECIEKLISYVESKSNGAALRLFKGKLEKDLNEIESKILLGKFDIYTNITQIKEIVKGFDIKADEKDKINTIEKILSNLREIKNKLEGLKEDFKNKEDN